MMNVLAKKKCVNKKNQKKSNIQSALIARIFLNVKGANLTIDPLTY